MENEGGANLPSFISAKNYSDFISNDFTGGANFDIRQMIIYIIGVAALVSSALRPYQGPLADEAKASFWLVL
jgi:hypothetical protein